MDFDYFYEENAEGYAFYRTPKIFFTEERFQGLSSDSKILYGILLDRVELSLKNGWKDGDGRVFVYMTIENVEEAIGRCRQTACKLMDELEAFGLIERKRQGQGKPARIYVKNFSAAWNSYLKKYENHTPRSMKIISQEVWKSYPNKTNNNKTEINKNNLILSATEGGQREQYRSYFTEKWELDRLYEDYPYKREFLDAIMEIALDVMCSKQKYLRIEGDEKPISVVQNAMMKLDSSHIGYVVESMAKNTNKVRNVKRYLLAALYNAPLTMETYFQSWVNHDTARGLFTNGGKTSEEG
jgi:hypothetical protein